MSWSKIFKKNIFDIKKDNYYRNFVKIRNLKKAPYSIYNNKIVINWCNNDYNNLSQNLDVKKTMLNSINKYGCGSSGTRNISGNSKNHEKLEEKISIFHNKDSGLIFNSGYLANYATISSFGKIFDDNTVLFSDERNHSSIIEGIKSSKLEKIIFKHNNFYDLEEKLKLSNKKNIIITESIFSMSGNVPDFKKLIYLKKKYDCLIYLDEIHAVAVHGNKGQGLASQYGVMDEIDILMGGFSKGFGSLGGYIVSDKNIIDCIKSFSSGFIFTTSLPIHLVDSNYKAIEYVEENSLILQKKRIIIINYFKKICKKLNIKLVKNNFNNSQIQCIYVGDSIKCKNISKRLLEYGHYIQPIFYPTVSKEQSVLRIALKPFHTKKMIRNFLNLYNELI